jgi:hypothetical protein
MPAEVESVRGSNPFGSIYTKEFEEIQNSATSHLYTRQPPDDHQHPCFHSTVTPRGKTEQRPSEDLVFFHNVPHLPQREQMKGRYTTGLGSTPDSPRPKSHNRARYRHISGALRDTSPTLNLNSPCWATYVHRASRWLRPFQPQSFPP